MAAERKYLVFMDADGYSIGRPQLVDSEESAAGMIENKPVDTVFHEINSAEELIRLGICDVEDFEEEEE